MKKPIAPPKEQAYLTWSNDREQAVAFSQAASALKKVEPIVRSHGSDIYLNIAPGNTSVRDGFGRRDYEDFRPEEALPRKPKDIIRACMDAYKEIGIIRNIIDLMADFAVQGIDINHPNERIEKFFKEWFRKVSGVERSERFLNMFYRSGNVILKRQTVKLTARGEDQLKKAIAEPDGTFEATPEVLKREIPCRYTILNPLSVELLSEELAPFIGSEAFLFGIKISEVLAKRVKTPRGFEKKLIEKIPEAIRKAINSGQKIIPLDPDKVAAFYYKRDDSEAWAEPMVRAILADLNMLQKMKLADLAALDGAISCIRVWKLGNLDAKIMPSEATIMRLAEMLANNVGGGVMDLVWGPDIELLETSTDVHRFLGDTKYAPVLSAIFQGLGIPPTLTGSATPGGFTNNFISLKTLTERLSYGRAALTRFWENEVRLVQKAMGFRFPASIVYDTLLTDEAAEKQLLLHLWDRNLISDEAIRERFRLTPEIEEVRVRREGRRRRDGLIPPKASPFHDPQTSEALEKLFAQTGAYAPSEFGLELKPKKVGEKVPMEVESKLRPKPVQGTKPKGQSGQGRPRLSKDKEQRKKKTVKPRTSARFIQNLATAEEMLQGVSKVISPAYLASLGKKTLRELSEPETRKLEDFKLACLCQFTLGQSVEEKDLRAVVKKTLFIPDQVGKLLKATLNKHMESHGKEPTLDVLRKYQAAVYAIYSGDYETSETGDSDNSL